MYTLKGFLHIGALANNNVSTTGVLGELAPIGYTYSREQTQYTHSDQPDLLLSVFTSQTDGTYTVPPSNLTSKVLEILQGAYDLSRNGTVADDSEAWVDSFLSFWGDQLTLLGQGAFLTYQSVYAPEYLDFSLTALAFGENRIRVWLASEAFLAQYDDYEALPVLAVESVDEFFGTYADVLAAATAFDAQALLAKVDEVANRLPYTRARVDVFEWVNPQNNAIRVPVPWGTVHYGAAGDNIDSVRELLVEYILANSTHTREEWTALFPDLFKNTEFIITPFWNHYAIPNQITQTGMHSPSIPRVDAQDTILRTVKGNGYTETYLADALTTTASMYKSMGLGVVGGPDNRDGITRFEAKFPDYLLVPHTHPEFHRMSGRTKGFILMLIEMLGHAEILKPFSSVPVGYTRLQREGVYYLVGTYEDVQYLVVTKYSLEDPLVGAINPGAEA